MLIAVEWEHYKTPTVKRAFSGKWVAIINNKQC